MTAPEPTYEPVICGHRETRCHRNLGMRHAHPPPRPRPLLRAAQDQRGRRRRCMKATHEQTCPRCPDPILPGQVIIPTPRGWTHATCIPGGEE
jgi:hypothetical protein